MNRACCCTAIAAALLAACRPDVLPPALSPTPSRAPAPAGELRAGLAKVDITPPPGVGLMGNGPEGARSRGYRQRLYVRAVVLEDAQGERLALVTADLTHVSAVLHREAARLLREPPDSCGGIGADRLFISAIHTHAAPGHFYEAANYNEAGSAVAGYDSLIVNTISARIAQAVCSATKSLRAARLGWGSAPVWHVSRIRSLPAMLRNVPPPEVLGTPPAGLSQAEELVNPTLWMLRIDTAGTAPGSWAPAGAYAAFSIHNTGNAPSGELLDSDIHGRVAQLVERAIDQRAGHAPATDRPAHSIFAFANGSHGDVSPNWPDDSRCPRPKMHPTLEPTGPLMRAPLDWHPVSDSALAHCDASARTALEQVAQQIAEAAIGLHAALADSTATPVTLARAFETIDVEDTSYRRLCHQPATGLSTFAGAPDSYSRMRGWRLLGLFDVGIDEPSARRNPSGCHGHKRQLVSEGINYKAAGQKLPTVMQLGVARIGDHLLLFTPAEVTTTAGRRLRSAALERAAAAGLHVREAIPVSLTNGFVQYLTTPEEYTAQYYEGGSTIYGPGELPFIVERIDTLVGSLAGVPQVQLQAIESRPGKVKRVVERPHHPTPDPALTRPRLVPPLRCGGDTLYADFTAGAPGEWVGDRVPMLQLYLADGEAPVAWDDDPRVAVYLTKSAVPKRWQLRFTPGDDAVYEIRLAEATERQRWSCTAGLR